jgi:hypothetical protein
MCRPAAVVPRAQFVDHRALTTRRSPRLVQSWRTRSLRAQESSSAPAAGRVARLGLRISLAMQSSRRSRRDSSVRGIAVTPSRDAARSHLRGRTRGDGGCGADSLARYRLAPRRREITFGRRSASKLTTAKNMNAIVRAGRAPSSQLALASDLTAPRRTGNAGRAGASKCVRLRDGLKRLGLRRGCSIRTARHAALPGVSMPVGGRPAVSCAGSRFRGRACAARAAGTEARGRRSAPRAARAGR